MSGAFRTCSRRHAHVPAEERERVDAWSDAAKERDLRGARGGASLRTHEVAMNLTMMLLLHDYPTSLASFGASGPDSPRPQDPGPEGGEGESVGDVDDEPETQPEKGESAGANEVRAPATPDANPIDPRVFGELH